MASSWAESALSWWEEAGVDTIVGEEPRDWLNPDRPRPPRRPPAPARPGPPPRRGAARQLDAFQAWLAATDALPFAAPAAPRDRARPAIRPPG